jgi:uncharacterized membrane protein YdjX (TVP38/TMEM64 family)
MEKKLVVRSGVAIGAALAVVAAALHWSELGPSDLRERFAGFGAWAPLVYVLVYAVAGLLFVPATPLTLAGGVLFGVVEGTLYALAAAVISSGVAFLAARHLGADWVRRRAGRRLARLVRGVEAEGWRFVAFVRLVPIFPLGLVNYGLGLTRIRFDVYLLATAVCMVPGTLAYAYVGDAGAAAVGGEANVRALLIGIGILAALAFLPRLILRLRHGGIDAEGAD